MAKGLGIIDTITLAITLAVALPVGLLGVDFLLSDRPLLGAVFVGIAVLMVIVEEYMIKPSDLPGMVAKRFVGGLVKSESNGTNDTETESKRW